jgi:Ca2+-transporting ATPase
MPSPPASTPVADDDRDAPAWYRRSGNDVAAAFEVDPAEGLSGDEVAARRERHGPNRLAEPDRRSAWRRFVDQFTSPLIGVLAAAAVLAGAVGEIKDALVIAGVLTLNAILGFVQEGRAENALAALEGMLALQVTVRRDGRAVDVASEEIVPGDIVLLEAGDRVPADGRLWTASAAAADESMLTGESVPADKSPEPLDGDLEPADRANVLFMNTTLVRGRVEMVVTGTGMDTEVGQIAEMLSSSVETDTPLEKQLDALGKRLIVIVLVAVAIVLALALARGREVGEAILEAVALGVAAIPEGLPAVVTVTLAVGVSKMAKSRAIVRRLASVETLGSTTVICTDKTGTLTRNEMTPVEVWHAGRGHPLADAAFDGDVPGSLVDALTVAVHASDASLAAADGGDDVGDPTELALLVAARAAGVDTDGVRRAAPRRGELPFDSATKLMATLPDDDRDGHLIAVKGAPDVLLATCTVVAGPDGDTDLDDDVRADLDAALDRFAERGQRVLAIASRRLDDAPATDPDAIAERLEHLTLQALVAMVDPPRDGVGDAVARCRGAGIRVKMITGDHPGTAAAIAEQIGIDGDVVTGRDLDAMDDTTLADAIGDIGVCARVSPEHKVRIVDALRDRGEVVAMTGDGVNDAAALRRADVGVAMGIAGTEVTKEASDMVLADDNFTTIVTAVERGRTIYDNIRKFVRFQLTTNLAAIVSILTAGIVGLPAPFTALQILFVNLIADGPPAMALGVDPPRTNVMDQRPRATDASILDWHVLRGLARTGLIMAVVTVVVLATSEGESQLTMTFTTFVLLQLANVLAVRSGASGVIGRHQFHNRWVWGAIALVLAIQIAVVHVGFMQDLFETVALSGEQWLVAGALSLVPLVVAEVSVRLSRWRDARPA